MQSAPEGSFMDQQLSVRSRRTGLVRASQNITAGVMLLALCLLALWLVRDLSQGTLGAIGPALLPRALAVGVGLCGAALIVAGFGRAGAALEGWSARGPLFIMLAVSAFGLTIRPVQLGGLTTPGLGLVVAGPLAIMISGYATPEARFRELLILALSLTPFCMILFGDLLNLPIPLFPQPLADALPADWTQRQTLRATSAALAAAAGVIWLLGRIRRT